jgi:hypothetical protein
VVPKGLASSPSSVEGAVAVYSEPPGWSEKKSCYQPCSAMASSFVSGSLVGSICLEVLLPGDFQSGSHPSKSLVVWSQSWFIGSVIAAIQLFLATARRQPTDDELIIAPLLGILLELVLNIVMSPYSSVETRTREARRWASHSFGRECDCAGV